MTQTFPASEQRLQSRTLRDLQPLDVSGGEETLPACLSDALIGPIPGIGEAALFVLLDAGRVPALVERLAQADQPAVSLFQGEAADDLADTRLGWLNCVRGINCSAIL